jgi:hypothetical protein
MLSKNLKDILRLKLELSDVVLQMLPGKIKPVAQLLRRELLLAAQSAISEFQEHHNSCKGKDNEKSFHNIPVE